ncbi:MAG: MFS transporter [Alphaproteobacteria bacterium]
MPPVRLLVLACAFLAFTLMGLHAFAALLPHFIVEWGLTNTEAGWLNGMPNLAYMIAVPFLAITDRMDARRLLIWGALVNAVGYIGFGLFADGFWSASVYRSLQGLGLAATYVPGLKALGDRIDGPFQARAASLYVSSFAIGSSLSVLIAIGLAQVLDWRWAFLVPGMLNLAAAALAVMIPPKAPQPAAGRTRIFNYGPVLRNRRAMGCIVGYLAHSVELIGVRGWTVAFLTFAGGLSLYDGSVWTLALIVTGLNFVGVPASMIAGEVGARFGMARTAAIAMGASGVAAVLVALAVGQPLLLLLIPVVLHNMLLLADSGPLSGGAVAASDAATRGATMGLFALGGAIGGFVGPVLFGVVLDLFGRDGLTGWSIAFATMGAVAAAGGAVLWLMTAERRR